MNLCYHLPCHRELSYLSRNTHVCNLPFLSYFQTSYWIELGHCCCGLYVSENYQSCFKHSLCYLSH